MTKIQIRKVNGVAMGMLDEVWKDIIGYEGLYKVSNHGRVLSVSRRIYMKNSKSYLRKDKIMSPYLSKKGYLRIYLTNKDGKPNIFSVHRLVATEFLPNIYKLEQVNHKDGKKDNNHIFNLEWCDDEYNRQHAYENGLKTMPGFKPVIDLFSGFVYGSMKAAAKAKNIPRRTIQGALPKGVYKDLMLI